MSRTLLIALCLGLVAICGGRARADLVMNGGFETETPTGCSSNCTVPPPDWAATGGGILIDTAFPNTGTYDVAFTALTTDTNPGVLSQSLATVAGQSYTLNFALLDNGGYALDTFTVTLGAFSATITGDQAAPPGDISGSESGYTAESFTVPAADISGSDMLTFQGLSDPTGPETGWNLDDVSVNQVAVVPAPVTGHGLTVFLAVGGILLGARLLERSRKRNPFGTARPI